MTQRTSLVVHWLRICLAIQRTWVQSLVGEVRSYMPQGKEAHVLHKMITNTDALGLEYIV